MQSSARATSDAPSLEASFNKKSAVMSMLMLVMRGARVARVRKNSFATRHTRARLVQFRGCRHFSFTAHVPMQVY